MWQKLKNLYHLTQSVIGKYRYRVSSEGLTFIGITGTDGKTTTGNLLYHILKHAGYKTALISTISAIIGQTELDTGFHVTTPSPMSMQRYIADAKKSGATHVVLEVTSHALDQYRVFGIPFHTAVLTNITDEHLDYHKTYERYVKAKVKLLRMARYAVINADDASYAVVMKLLRSFSYKGEIRTYSLHNKADITLDQFPFQTKLLGEFNKANILAAVSAAKTLAIPDKVIREAIKSFTPPLGRTEIVHEGDFTVMIDFAHTPNSIEQILKTIKDEMVPKGRIIHVFGSAGERDAFKRPRMGEASARYADTLILTAEDPRSEPVEKINEAIIQGIAHKDRNKVREIPDRKTAIKQAIDTARKGDIVVITGKGHEKSMNLGDGEIPWSEHEAVREALVWKGLS